MNSPMYWERAVIILSAGEEEDRYDEAVNFIVKELCTPSGSHKSSWPTVIQAIAQARVECRAECFEVRPRA